MTRLLAGDVVSGPRRTYILRNMFKIPLRLKPQLPNPDNPDAAQPDTGPAETDPPEMLEGVPFFGAAAIAFGILGIFTKGYIFVPLALITSLVALFTGHVAWGFVGLLLTVAGLLTLPVLLAFLGIAWLLP